MAAAEVAAAEVAASGSDFSLFEEEYQVQLALALSASDNSGGVEDLDSVQMKAAKRMSLVSSAKAEVGVGSSRGSREESLMDFLSLRYWSYNVVNYEEKLMDGFYDVYGVVMNPNSKEKMPSLVDLQAMPVTDNIDYEVVLVNRIMDHSLQQIEKKAALFATQCKVDEHGPISSGLIQKIADLVVGCMGGPVADTEDILRRWTSKSYELRTSLNTIVLPLGLLEVGLSRHRALLFKVIADRVNIPCKLVKGSYYTGTDEGAVNLIKVDHDSEYIVDLMGAPGTLIPAEVFSTHLQNSGFNLTVDTIDQTVQDLCLALDNANSLSEINSHGSQASLSGHNSLSGISPPQLDEHTRGSGASNNSRNSEKSPTEKPVNITSQSRSDALGNPDVISSAQQMKVHDVSKYVVTAAKNPEFAQKLHAVLLESGASPPLDLFSDLNMSQDMVNRKETDNAFTNDAETSDPVGNNNENTRNLQCRDIILSPLACQLNQEYLPSAPCQSEIVNNLNVVGTQCTSENERPDASDTTKEEKMNERLKTLLDGVAEWEIPWEALHIGERIGLGSYGEVYRADWNGTEVAVKKFLDQGLSGDALEQFRCEVKIMLRLRHPNVVLFMGAVTRPPNLSILTEFLPRGSLYRLLHRPNVKLDEKRRLKMALDVIKGMNYLHTSNPIIVHRDLKSPNLLVDRNWVVKVCDFGLSKVKHHTFLSSKSTAGTPEWMAPEVLRNERSNEKCDVYSFGVILWELATMRMPWGGMNPMQVVGAVGFQDRRLDIPKEIDPMVAQIITDCWDSDPNKRPSFAQLMSPIKQLQRLVVPTS